MRALRRASAAPATRSPLALTSLTYLSFTLFNHEPRLLPHPNILQAQPCRRMSLPLYPFASRAIPSPPVPWPMHTAHASAHTLTLTQGDGAVLAGADGTGAAAGGGQPRVRAAAASRAHSCAHGREKGWVSAGDVRMGGVFFSTYMPDALLV
jgi:hypothetical protein